MQSLGATLGNAIGAMSDRPLGNEDRIWIDIHSNNKTLEGLFV
jgi:hypothetical protein